MGEASPNSTVTAPSGAVFLSYASQDVGAAKRICDALRAAGVEVWFDQSELRGGDAWDQSIRRQIKTCALFIPVISRHTHERDEGYFRLEWKLAVDRCHLMAADKAFLLPVVVDDTRDDDERVPERFREVQWTRLPGGNTPPAFVERVKRLLAPQPTSGHAASTSVPRASGTREPLRPSWRSKTAVGAIVALLAAASLYLLVEKPWVSKHPAPPPVTPAAPSGAPSPTAVAFSPPAHSIAVLPFVNMSGDKEQEYFSDGLTEELLNSLAAIEGLQVAGRTSSFYFKGEHADLGTVAHKLNVGTVLEGSVRRSGHRVRITAQLINAVTGFHLWSHTYDRDLTDVLKLQTEVATAVAGALKVTLIEDVAKKIELGGTRSPAAFDAYLRAGRTYSTFRDEKTIQAAITGYREAIQLDPSYALALADLSIALTVYTSDFARGQAVRDGFDAARADAQRALALTPDLARAHVALARNLELGSLDFVQADAEYHRALALAPSDARTLQVYGMFAALMGRADEGVAACRRAVVLDPLNPLNHGDLGLALLNSRRYPEAVTAYRSTLALEPDGFAAAINLGVAYYWLGEFEDARALCEVHRESAGAQGCLAVVYEKLGRHAEAEAALAHARSFWGDASASTYASIYAQWGNRAMALKWLETAYRVRDSGLESLKVDAAWDPLRNEPRFQAIERELKFPQ